MKKIILLLTLFTLASTSAKAQGFYFGPVAGMNISTLTKQSYSKSRVRGNVGVQIGYQASNVFAIHAEALYSWQGSKFTNSDQIASFNYIKIPLQAKMFIVGGLNVEAGVSFNFLMNSRLKTTVDGQEVNLNTTEQSEVFDLSIPVGINYLFAKKIEVGMRYDISTIRVWKDSENKSRNSNFSINLRYRF